MHVRCAISPDADDLFMFWALLEGRIDTRGLAFDISSRDTDALNRMASGDGPDVCAISIAHYPAVADRYRLLGHGGSVGRGYGPVLVAPGPGELCRVGVPGLSTTACLVLRLIMDFEPVVLPIVPPQRAFEALRAGEVDAALLIHEGRLTYAREGFVERLDIGTWWQRETGLPLPLGGNVIRRDLPADVLATADAVLRESITHAMAHRDEAIDWLLARGGVLKARAEVDHYLSLYANADTVDYGEDGRAGIRELLRRGAAAGWIREVDVDFA
ncbi:MAG: menaquinone biosynthesis family protein [Myxococcota bacterium]